MAANKNRISITISKAAVARLRELAEGLGYVNQTGRFTGQGSVSGMLQALGDGELVVWPRRSHDERIEACRRGVRLAEDRGDAVELRLAKAVLQLAEASAAHDAVDTPEQRGSAEWRDAWLVYVQAVAEHGAALLASETTRLARESQGRLDLGPDGEK